MEGRIRARLDSWLSCGDSQPLGYIESRIEGVVGAARLSGALKSFLLMRVVGEFLGSREITLGKSYEAT